MIKYNINHVNGLYFSITDDEGKNREYDVSFVERPNNRELYKTRLKVGGWARLSRRYLSDIAVVVRHDGRTVKQVNFLDEIPGKRVLISFDSKALGDTLAWIPYCLEFSRHYRCKVVVSTFKNFLFERTYPELEFIGRGVRADNLIAMFEIGWFWEPEREPVNPATIPLQQTITNILNLPHREICPIIDFAPGNRPVEGRYVCISMYSTSQCKLWYYWQELVDFLVSSGYKVIEISKENDMMGQRTSDLKGVEELSDKSLESTMNHLHHCDFFIGLSSGLSWLAYALRKKVYMIANFTRADHEFTLNTVRITDESICNSCWNDPKFRFNKGDWRWCPEHEDTPRHFECHRLITAERVINEIRTNENI